MTSISDILERRKPAQTAVRLLLDGELSRRIGDLTARIATERRREAREGSDLASQLPNLQRELADLQAQAEDEAVVFRFQAVPRSKLAELVAACPPTPAQLERYKEAAKVQPFRSPPEYDDASLAPLLMAASATEPTMTGDEAKRLWDELSDGEAAQLWSAVLEVNFETSPRPTFGTGTDTTPTSGPESTTPPNGESLSRSS